MILDNIIGKFCINGRAMNFVPYGNGHINTTYLVTCDTTSRYILQKINKFVFKNPEQLMQNIVMVTQHLKKTANSRVLTVVSCTDGGMWHLDGNGEFWRMYDFVEESVCKETVESAEIFRESGAAFGRFINQMADFDASTLVETIPHFHDTPHRYQAFHRAVKTDAFDRAKLVQREIDFALAREDFASTLINLQKSGDMPTRVTHNDSKLNNVLFHHKSLKALCVIDLDTVMPGLVTSDFGDSIRFGATTGAEDERNLDKVNFSLPLYRAYREGFMTACDALNPCETEHLRHGAKMMTLECGLRFLTDYLNGDTYFKIHRDGHNLDRCRTQFKLVADMEKIWEEMIKL
jgi:Ser/Thr protein kinase RdoA (MazF antagonist)